MATASVYSRVLQRAAEILGSRAKLCKELRVPLSDLEGWIADKAKPPKGIFLKAIDVILGDMPDPRDFDPERSPEPRDSSSGESSSSTWQC